jgi:RNA polymerase sigma factor (sigma-70 family)
MRNPKTDTEILLLLRGDHHTAFSYLYRAHYTMVEYFVTNNSGNNYDAEDIFQETMLVLFGKARNESFELSCSVKTFVYSIARNLWLKKLRDNRLKTGIKDFEQFEDIPVDETPADTDREEKVKKALEQLGDACRKILVLFYYQKKRMDEIASEMGYTNADNAKNQKYKCLQQLKTKLGNG